MLDDHRSFELARLAFDERRYTEAAQALEHLLRRHPDDRALRELLARAFFGAAMLSKAEDQARELVRRDPSDAYAHLLLARSLDRQNRPADARGHHVLAGLLGGDGDWPSDEPRVSSPT